MDGFTYNNIFESKGIEYIAIIIYFIILVPFWMILNKKFRNQIKLKIGTLTDKMLRVPQGLFYSKNHTWTYLEKTGTAKIGLDDLISHIVGYVNIKMMKKPGDDINKGEIIAEINNENKSLYILSPISGKVLGANKFIIEQPELINDDPYNGWLFKIKPNDWIEETKTYYMSEYASNWLINELQRFKDFISVSVEKNSPEPSMVILQDGGELRDHILTNLPIEIWEDFQNNFMNL